MASPATATLLGFLFLTANTALAIRKSSGDAGAMIFVVASYASLVLLFYCLRRFETAPPRSATRDRTKVGVWLTTTLLTAMFSWRVSALMPWPVSTGVYCLRRFETAPPGPDGRPLTTKFAFIAFLAWGFALATYRVSGDDPASVLFVAASYYVGLLLLLCCFRALGRPTTTGSRTPWERARHAVRALSTLLTRGCRTMDRQSALAMILFAIPMCVSALAAHSVRADAGSKVSVFVSYAGLLTGVNLFLGTFNFNDHRDNCTRQGQEQQHGLGGVGAHDTAHGHGRVEE